MKKYILILCIAIGFNETVKANALSISTPIYNDGNKTITFNISWENSWKLSAGPGNWDGVWVFIKRQACSTTNIWATALVSKTSADHASSASGTNLLSVDAVSDGMGVFIRRTYSGMGTIGVHTITLKLYGTMATSPSITPSSSDNFKIFGIEMVYVPEGQFYLGDGRQSNSHNFSAGNNAGTPLLITAALQAAGLGASTNYTSNPMYGCPNYLPATYPLGYNGFWCMKYETTVVSYVDFLNCLSYDQQAVRLAKWGTRYPNSVNSNFTNGQSWRTDIHTSVAGTYNTIPATFTYNTTYETYSVLGYMSWLDLTAYLDWTGLRPMNDFEYEKACRGPINPIANEYPWGNTSITQAYNQPTNFGTFQERANQFGEGICLYSWNDENRAPYRPGIFATQTTTRSQSGATYYGIMEMGGNVSEQVVGGGSGYDYSNFTTANGDGALGTNGNANTPGWPTGIGANQGNYCKGGDFNGYGSHPSIIQVSDRQLYGGNTYNNGQSNGTGGRGVRSFPN